MFCVVSVSEMCLVADSLMTQISILVPPHTHSGLAFSVDMSGDDFLAFMKNEGLPDMDCTKLAGKQQLSKATYIVS